MAWYAKKCEHCGHYHDVEDWPSTCPIALIKDLRTQLAAKEAELTWLRGLLGEAVPDYVTSSYILKIMLHFLKPIPPPLIIRYVAEAKGNYGMISMQEDLDMQEKAQAFLAKAKMKEGV